MQLRRALAAVALAALAVVPGGTAHAAPTTDPADAGAGWLGRKVGTDGFIAGQSGPDRNSTALAVLAFAAAGTSGDAMDRAVAALAANVDAYVKDGNGTDRPGALGTLIQVAVATGRDPRAFGGADLVARLIATKRTSGGDAGLFGAQDPKFDGAYRQALGLLGLAAAGTTDQDAVGWLTRQQCPDGGWEAYRADTSAPCTPTNTTTFTGEDSNSTAIAAQALDALRVTPTASPLAWLDSAQNADGGFGYLAGNTTDANSTALAIQAIIALGEDPEAGRWRDADGDTPIAALLRLQLGCAAPEADRGAVAYQPETDGSLSPNVLATVQAVPALARTPLPVPRRAVERDAPTLQCGTRATASPAPTPAATPTASPSPRAITATPSPAQTPVLVVDDFGATLPDTGFGDGTWDTPALATLGLGLIGYGVLALWGARRLTRSRG